MKKKTIVLFAILIVLIPTVTLARSGCCSHHGGVAGCSSEGKQICNDGTLSPSCTCYSTSNYTYGCTDSSATNYNPSANRSDNSCIYEQKGVYIVEKEIDEEDENDSDLIIQIEEDANQIVYEEEEPKEEIKKNNSNASGAVVGILLICCTIFGIKNIKEKSKGL